MSGDNAAWMRKIAALNAKIAARAKYGHTGINGLNFNKSVTDPTSNLRRVVDFLSANPNASRADILIKVFRVHVEGIHAHNPRGYPRRKLVTRGWGGLMFMIAIRCGFITKTRVGRLVMYNVGPTAVSVGIAK